MRGIASHPHLSSNLYTSKNMIPAKWTHNLPFLTLALALSSLLISCTFLSETLQYDRTAIANGHFWLLLTGHLSHWSPDHLLWDLLVFVVLGIMAERYSRRGLILCLTISAVLISAILWVWQQDMDCYRGLSGLDSALFGFTALCMTRERICNKDLKGAGIILFAGVAFFFKIMYEFCTLQTIFTSSATIFTPVPVAHLTGCLVGIGVAFFLIFHSADEGHI